MSGKKLLIIVGIALVLLAVPASLYIYTQQQPQKPARIASTRLEFSPATGIKKVDDVTEFKIKLDPGSTAVSFVSLDITYDSTKFDAASNALVVDKAVIPLILQGPVYTAGRIRVNLSTGNDPAAALTRPAIIGSLRLRAVGSTNGETTKVAFGSGTQILSVSSSGNSNDQSGENTLSSSTPAQIMIADAEPRELIAAGSPAPEQPTPTTIPANEEPSFVSPTHSPSPTSTTQSSALEATATPTPVTPTPTSTITPSPTIIKTVAGVSDVPTVFPTVTPEVLSDTVDTPTPTIDAAGPGTIFFGFGAFFFLLIIGGGILLFIL